MEFDAPLQRYEETIDEIERAFGCRADEIFDDISVIPVASGSIAQVRLVDSFKDGVGGFRRLFGLKSTLRSNQTSRQQSNLTLC
jgi:hypothetical protein